uniref:Uncharacterized protein n=1 Tax=Salvator merianae TaxID=96440 RepID=A0A8D0DSR1_SALMN
MVQSSLSSCFRCLDISQFNKTETEGGNGPEVKAALRQGNIFRAFHAALQNCPVNTKNQAAKEQAQEVVSILKRFKSWSKV